MRLRFWPVGRRLVVVVIAAGVTLSLLSVPAMADADRVAARGTQPREPVDVVERGVPSAERAVVLGEGWQKVSDRAVVTSGDATGFHILVADSGEGYEWRSVASLSEPGMETDQWIGNMCVTGSGRRAVVVYAPRHFSNREYLAERGGFTAVVDLETGAVTKLSITTSLAYFNPGCGASETAVLTQGGGDDLRDTRLHTVDTVTGMLAASMLVEGQVTSPVPTSRGIVAAAPSAVVQVAASGKTSVLAETAGAPYRMAADQDGGIVFLQSGDNRSAQARRLAFDGAGTATVSTLATGTLTEIGVTTARGGIVFITGDVVRAKGGSLPQSVRVGGAARDAKLSLNGAIAVTKVSPSVRRDPTLAPPSAADEQPVDITATVLATGKEFTLAAVPTPMGGSGGQLSPALAEMAIAGDPHDPTDSALRTCGVLRNDPRNQPMQPKPRQVEWAVNQLVTDSLNVTREANWKNLGMPSYSVSNWFPQQDLVGGGRVPAQILLGIALAESNLAEAAWFAVPGVTANPLIGNYYGVSDRSGDISEWQIDFHQADCGYGVMQITDGMRKAGTERPGKDAPALPHEKQRAIALDFVANIAEGQRILASKWNAIRSDGMQLNGGDSGYLENWFYALWAYNSGYYRKADRFTEDRNGAWGVGWFNNPINPQYDKGREPFMRNPDDGRHPQDWPYPEKVLGYAGYPVHLIESPGVMVPAFRPAGWPNEVDKLRVKPPIDLFCDDTNSCSSTDPTHHYCVRTDFRCWYNQTTGWKPGCDAGCGQQFIRFDGGYPYQEDGRAYAPNCSFGLVPENARVIDNIHSSIPATRPGCSMSFSDAGSFTFTFAGDSSGNYHGKIDTHQIGTGFRAHFWMSNTTRSPNMKVTGTWTMDEPIGPWGRVLVHLPVVGARTQQARYEIDVDGNGTYRKHRYLPQEIQQNGWVSLGVFNFKGIPSVRLSNITEDGRGTERIAWDALAVQPLPAKPQHIVAALGDSYASGEGAGSYYVESDANHGTHRWNACRRSFHAWPRKLVLPGTNASLGTLVDRHDPHYELGFVACSGARTGNVTGLSGPPQSWSNPESYELGEGQFHEVAQIDSGVLDEHTTLVTFTIGGNDEAAFPNALVDCGGLSDCSTDEQFVPKYKAIIDRTQSRLSTAIDLIHNRAPNATIVVLAYPELFSRTTKCAGSWYYDMPEVHALAELAGYIATKQKETADSLRAGGIQVHAASPINEFVGHGGCDEQEWIHKVRVGPNGDGDFHRGDKPTPFCFWWGSDECLSREAFHPLPDGTSAYARVFRRKLDEIGYPGR